MRDLAVDLGTFDFAKDLVALDELSNKGIVQRDGDRIFVTEAGRPFVRLVAAAFDAYLPEDQKRHSLAVQATRRMTPKRGWGTQIFGF
jgi:oxygen-independent coproporphyrinogen III oxidase